MALSFSAQALQNGDRLTLIAKDDASGGAILVNVSEELLGDHGFEAVQEAAEVKFAAGAFEADGSLLIDLDDLFAD